MTDQFTPFDSTTLEDLKKRLSDLDRADALLEQAIRGGIDMSDQKKQSADLRAQIMKFRQAFFPGQ